jgi:phage gpG-like protein
MASFTIELDRDKRYQRLLHDLSSALDDPSVILYALGRALVRAHQARHQQGLDPEGAPWRKLRHPDYPAGRKGGPLNRTGAMLRALNYNVEDKNTLRIGFVGADGAPAKYHQEGSRAHVIQAKNHKALKLGALGIFRKSVQHPGLPARPLLGWPESDRQLVEDELVDYLQLVLERRRNG